MSRFKIGDKIVPIERGRGFEEATVLKIFTETKGVHKGKEMYLLRIINGTATMAVSAEANYKLEGE